MTYYGLQMMFETEKKTFQKSALIEQCKHNTVPHTGRIDYVCVLYAIYLLKRKPNVL